MTTNERNQLNARKREIILEISNQIAEEIHAQDDFVDIRAEEKDVFEWIVNQCQGVSIDLAKVIWNYCGRRNISTERQQHLQILAEERMHQYTVAFSRIFKNEEYMEIRRKLGERIN